MKFVGLFSVVMAIFTFVAVPVQSSGSWIDYLNDEGKLYSNITRGKYPHLRPVSSKDENINVTLHFQMLYINDLDVETGFLSADMRVGMRWIAKDLSWNPGDFAGIDTLHIPTKRVWVPDLSMYNGCSDGLTLVKTPVVVTHEGQVTWFAPAQVRIPCDLNMQRFPYDSHTCSATFGSWVYNGHQVDFHSKESDMHVREMPSNEWDVTSSSVVRHEITYECCPEPYISMDLIINVQRKSTVLAYVYISPMVLLALLCPFMFLLPYQHSQRITLGGSLLICLILLLVNLDHVFPTTFSGLPFISIYYMSVLVMLVLAMVSSAIILNLAGKKTEPNPILKRILGRGLGCFLFVKSEDYAYLVEGDEEDKARKSDEITWRYIAAVLDRFFFALHDAEYMRALQTHLPLILETFHPDLILYDAGVDPHVKDELGKLDLTDQVLFDRDYYVMNEGIRRGIPLVTVIGGGYSHDLDELSIRHTIVHRAATKIWNEYNL